MLLILLSAIISIKPDTICDCEITQLYPKPANYQNPFLEKRRLFESDESKAKRLERKVKYIGSLSKREALAFCRKILSHRLFFEQAQNDSLNDYDICTICILANDDTSVKTLNCGHSFHTQCLKQCILTSPKDKKSHCPNCRQNFIQIRKPTSTSVSSPTASHRPRRFFDKFIRPLHQQH
jgi:hypothetical protein